MRLAMTRFGLLIVLVLAGAGTQAAPAADLWPFWDASDESSSTRVDHQPWQRLLDRYLVVTETPPTLFRYDAVTAEDRAALDDYLASLAAIDPRTLARAEQLPYWINLYNALTVQVVLDHPAEDSIRDMGDGFFRPGPWNDDLVRIAGEDLTLNDVEHRILRPIWNDHHIHFVVNCASIGCPSLAARAYTRENTRELMEQGERRYLNDPRGLDFLPDGRLQLSSIFDWYQADFGNDRDALLGYLAEQRPDLATRLQGYDSSIAYHYDWSLNDAP
ncbi:MAG: DUF547 domain-containing protein [Gammaproteobacteria bacterium]|jgi:hypothetical protein|nr:DUF547 domain-containing protein [Gammaproteobacteria bacterium]